MRCRQARDLMTERLDAGLDAPVMEALEEHLALCDACRAEWRGLRVNGARPAVSASTDDDAHRA